MLSVIGILSLVNLFTMMDNIARRFEDLLTVTCDWYENQHRPAGRLLCR